VVCSIWKTWREAQNIYESEALEQLADLERAEEAQIQEWLSSQGKLDEDRSRL
jgi:uncharacterized protein YqeY